jgi:hypothetical protein
LQDPRARVAGARGVAIDRAPSAPKIELSRKAEGRSLSPALRPSLRGRRRIGEPAHEGPG